jgi:hypothetical protein
VGRIPWKAEGVFHFQTVDAIFSAQSGSHGRSNSGRRVIRSQQRNAGKEHERGLGKMKVINRLERLSEKLNTVKLTSTKEKNGTYKIKFKDTILFDGIPNETMQEYIMAETAACFSKMGAKVDEYLKLTKARTEQLELELFKKEAEVNV